MSSLDRALRVEVRNDDITRDSNFTRGTLLLLENVTCDEKELPKFTKDDNLPDLDDIRNGEASNTQFLSTINCCLSELLHLPSELFISYIYRNNWVYAFVESFILNYRCNYDISAELKRLRLINRIEALEDEELQLNGMICLATHDEVLTTTLRLNTLIIHRTYRLLQLEVTVSEGLQQITCLTSLSFITNLTSLSVGSLIGDLLVDTVRCAIDASPSLKNEIQTTGILALGLSFMTFNHRYPKDICHFDLLHRKTSFDASILESIHIDLVRTLDTLGSCIDGAATFLGFLQLFISRKDLGWIYSDPVKEISPSEERTSSTISAWKEIIRSLAFLRHDDLENDPRAYKTSSSSSSVLQFPSSDFPSSVTPYQLLEACYNTYIIVLSHKVDTEVLSYPELEHLTAALLLAQQRLRRSCLHALCLFLFFPVSIHPTDIFETAMEFLTAFVERVVAYNSKKTCSETVLQIVSTDFRSLDFYDKLQKLQLGPSHTDFLYSTVCPEEYQSGVVSYSSEVAPSSLVLSQRITVDPLRGNALLPSPSASDGPTELEQSLVRRVQEVLNANYSDDYILTSLRQYGDIDKVIDVILSNPACEDQTPLTTAPELGNTTTTTEKLRSRHPIARVFQHGGLNFDTCEGQHVVHENVEVAATIDPEDKRMILDLEAKQQAEEINTATAAGEIVDIDVENLVSGLRGSPSDDEEIAFQKRYQILMGETGRNNEDEYDDTLDGVGPGIAIMTGEEQDEEIEGEVQSWVRNKVKGGKWENESQTAVPRSNGSRGIPKSWRIQKHNRKDKTREKMNRGTFGMRG